MKLSESAGVAPVTAILPVFNGASEIGGAIDSVLEQKDVPVEIIVINDGSTDDTRSVLDGYGDRIRAFHQRNIGLAATRNRGIQLAKGDWVAFLDHDDRWEPDKLSAQLDAARTSRADVVYTNAANFGELDRVGQLRNDPAAMPEGDVFAELLQDNFITISSVMMRRALFETIEPFSENLPVCEDWDLWLRASGAGATFVAVAEPLTAYRWHSGSMSKQHDKMKRYREEVVRRAMTTARGGSLSWVERRQALAGVYATSAWFVAEGSSFRAIQWNSQALMYWPLNWTAWKQLAKGCLCRA